MKKVISIFSLIVFSALISNGFGQEEELKKKPLNFKPLKFNISEDGSQWLRFILWNQVQINSNDLDGDEDFNVKPNVRRSRLLVLGQVTPKVFTYLQIGVNNINSGRIGQIDGSDQSQAFLHDAAIEYKFSDALAIGGGLHYWRGLARLSSWSGLSSLTFDIPNPLVFAGTIGATDQFTRHVGIYAKGKLKKFEYRLAINDPSLNGFQEDPVVSTQSNAVYGAWNYHDRGRTIIEGNIKYNIIGDEGNLLPYVVGTYLGKKKTLSVSTGFIYHPESSIVLKDNANPILDGDDNTTIAAKTNTTDATHFSLDINYDTPIGTNGGALTAYTAYINYDFGQNGGSSAAATGEVFYTQIGYLIPKTKLQPYLVYQDRGWDDNTVLGSQRAGNTFNFGANYYVSSHNLRLTLEYLKNSFDSGADTSQLRFQVNIFL